MEFWISALVMAAAAMVALFIYARSFRGTQLDPLGHDRELYQARLTEIQQDLKIGRLDQQSSHAAQIEEARKLIRLENISSGSRKSIDARLHSVILYGALLFVPLFSFIFYLGVEIPPRINTAAIENQNAEPAGQTIEKLVAATEARLAANPSDGIGWAVIAPVYFRLDRIRDSIKAYRNALRHTGRKPILVAGLAEVLVYEASGIVSSEAMQLFREALVLQPEQVSARFYLGLASEQGGDKQGARTIWQALLDQASGDEPWLAEINARLSSLDAAPKLDENLVSQIGKLNDSERSEMINTMVATLAERLKDNPDDRAGWERLVRSYYVLGSPDKAQNAIDQARTQFPDDLSFIGKLQNIEASLEPAS